MTTPDKAMIARALIECPVCGDFDGIGYGVDDFDGTAVVCGNCDHVGPGAEPGNREEAMRLWKDRPTIVAVAARLTALLAENAALKGLLDDANNETASALTENTRLRGKVEQKDGTLRYLKRQAENGTLHNQVVIQNCGIALGDAALSPAPANGGV